MTLTATQAWALFLVVAAFSGVSVAGLMWMIWKIRDYFCTWIVWWNEDANKVFVERRSIKTETIHRGKGTQGKAYFLDANARKSGNRGGLYVIDEPSGANLRGPGFVGLNEQLKAYDEKHRQTFRICDPTFVANKLRTNSYKNWLKTQEGDEDWRVKVAPLAFIALTVMTLVFGGVMFAMQSGS